MRSLLLQKILIKKIILYRTNILFLLSGVFFSQNYVFIIFVGRVLVGVGVGGEFTDLYILFLMDLYKLFLI